jgi:hypothetical protein
LGITLLAAKGKKSAPAEAATVNSRPDIMMTVSTTALRDIVVSPLKKMLLFIKLSTYYLLIKCVMIMTFVVSYKGNYFAGAGSTLRSLTRTFGKVHMGTVLKRSNRKFWQE